MAQRWIEKYGVEEVEENKEGAGSQSKADKDKRKAKELSATALSHYAIRSVMLERYFDSHPGEEKRDELLSMQLQKERDAEHLGSGNDLESHSDEQIEENKDAGDNDITESVKSFFQEKLGRSKPELTRELSTKGDDEDVLPDWK